MIKSPYFNNIYLKLIIISQIFISCKNIDKKDDVDKYENLNTFEFKNYELKSKVLEFITKSDEHGILNESILLELGTISTINEPDTIITIYNAVPYTCDNIKGFTILDGKKIFFYSLYEDYIFKNLIQIKRPFTDCVKYVDVRQLEMTYQMSYKYKNGKVVRLDE